MKNHKHRVGSRGWQIAVILGSFLLVSASASADSPSYRNLGSHLKSLGLSNAQGNVVLGLYKAVESRHITTLEELAAAYSRKMPHVSSGSNLPVRELRALLRVPLQQARLQVELKRTLGALNLETAAKTQLFGSFSNVALKAATLRGEGRLEAARQVVRGWAGNEHQLVAVLQKRMNAEILRGIPQTLNLETSATRRELTVNRDISRVGDSGRARGAVEGRKVVDTSGRLTPRVRDRRR